MFIATESGRMLDCNPACIRMLGFASKADALGTSFAGLFESPDSAAAALARLRSEHVVEGLEVGLRRADGGPILVIANLVASSAAEDAGEIKGYLVDVTERRQIEAQLRRIQRLDSVGRLAGGIAHDFNNLLSVIGGYAEMLLEATPSPSAAQLEFLSEIKAAADRATMLTRQLLAFSRQQMLQPRVMELNEIVRDIESLLRRLIGEHVELVLVLEPQLGRVRADPGQIQQVIMNLAINARDAMPSGGRLTIETRNAALDADYVHAHHGAREGPHVLLAMRDTGHGMDEETMARIFEPFFSTKQPGEGTGLGLSTVYGIVKQSGGSLWVRSEPGRGAAFEIFLPRTDDPLTDMDEALAQDLGRGSETVLVIEDEEAVRQLIDRALTERGYTVLQAGTAEQALRLAEAHDHIQAVVTDLVLPDGTGRELAERIVRTRPAVKVLYMSGYTDDAVTRSGILSNEMPFLQKPFSPYLLARRIRQLLD